MGKPPEATDSFVPEISGFADSMAWLRQRDVSAREIGDFFGTTAVNVRQIIWRYAPSRKITVVHPFLSEPLSDAAGIYQPVPKFLRKMLGIRDHEDSVILDRSAKRRLRQLEDQVEQLGGEFWSGVRYATGLRRFAELLPKVGYSAHHERIRLLARIRQLIAETHLHSGRTASAINEGLSSVHLYRTAFQESDWKDDLQGLGRSARLISQAFLLRHRPDMALHYLDIHQRASHAAGVEPRPEYYHQMAIAAFQEREDEFAPANLLIAMQKLRDTLDYGIPKREHEIRDIGERALNLIRGNWESSSQLLDYMLKHYPPDDIHISINVAWTAACGLTSTDSKRHARALDLLERHREAAMGFGRQVSIFRLLSLAPRLPAALRPDWVRRSLYANAFADE
jgi:hypothetical protein